MLTKRAIFRLLIMLGCLAGIAYGATQIDRLPPGPRQVLCRFGHWLQQQAETDVSANRGSEAPIRPVGVSGFNNRDMKMADNLSRNQAESAPWPSGNEAANRLGIGSRYPAAEPRPAPAAIPNRPLEGTNTNRKSQVPVPSPPTSPDLQGKAGSTSPQSSPERIHTPEADRSPSGPSSVELPGRQAAASSSANATSSLDKLAARLQELGAMNYLLERWGDDGRLYRFHCEVAIGDHPGLRQHFEAVAPTGEEAIRQVLAEVGANQ